LADVFASKLFFLAHLSQASAANRAALSGMRAYDWIKRDNRRGHYEKKNKHKMQKNLGGRRVWINSVH